LRYTELVEGIRIAFPNRTDEFNDGFEAGVLAMHLVVNTPTFTREIGADNIEQAKDLAQQFGYRAIVGREVEDGVVEITFTNKADLRVVK
jgi:hypothetical protein